ncbi:unnamed protein product [Brassica rapa subsp. trilocularis]
MYENSDDAFCLRKPWQATSTLKLTVLTREKMTFRHWWKEYADCSQGPIPQLKRRELVYLLSVSYMRNHNTVGGLGEEALFPVYWNGDSWPVLRVQKLLPIT